MPKRKPTDRVQVPVRMVETLRAELAKAAKSHGKSLNAEIVQRLGESLLQEKVYGSAKMKFVAVRLFGTFLTCGTNSAGGKEPEEWLRDVAAYSAASNGVVDALLSDFPGNQKDKRFLANAMIGGLQTFLARQEFNDGR